MSKSKAAAFWQTVIDHESTLCSVLDATPQTPSLLADLDRIGRIVEVLRAAVADIDPMLSVQVDQLPVAEGPMLRVAVSCNHDPAGIEAVQQLVAEAPSMPPRIKVCAFTPPIPKELVGDIDSLMLEGTNVPLHQVRFLAAPSIAAPGSFDVACFLPPPAVAGMDPHDVPGALVASIALSLGIGELRAMTRVNSLGIAVVESAPPEAVPAWDLIDIIDAALLH